MDAALDLQADGSADEICSYLIDLESFVERDEVPNIGLDNPQLCAICGLH